MRKIFILLFIGILGACNKRGEVMSVPTLNFSVETTTNGIKLSELTNNISYLSLETTDSTIVDQIVRIVQKDGFIYIADKQSLYQFDLKGKCRKKITHQGKGPEEYLSITDFQIDNLGNPWVLSRNDHKLLHYNWCGIQQQQIQLACWVSKINLENNNTMYLYIGNEKDKDNSHQLKVLNLESQKIEKDYLPIDDKKSAYLHVFSNDCFSHSSSESFFFQMFNDTIYKLSANQLTPAYYLNWEKKNIPASFFESQYQDVMDFFGRLHANKYAYGNCLLMKSGDTVWASYIYDKQCFFSVLKDGKCSSGTSIKDDVYLSGYPIEMMDLSFYQSNNALFIILWPGDILDYCNENLNKEQQEEIQKRIGVLTTERNPVILKLEM